MPSTGSAASFAALLIYGNREKSGFMLLPYWRHVAPQILFHYAPAINALIRGCLRITAPSTAAFTPDCLARRSEATEKNISLKAQFGQDFNFRLS